MRFFNCLLISSLTFSTWTLGQDLSGQATFYTEYSQSLGSCGFDVQSIGQLIVALPSSFGKSKCGQCIKVHGAKGDVVVKVTDTCPGCPGNNIDLSDIAFGQIDDLSKGRVQVSWDFVSCSNSGSVTPAVNAPISSVSAPIVQSATFTSANISSVAAPSVSSVTVPSIVTAPSVVPKTTSSKILSIQNGSGSDAKPPQASSSYKNALKCYR